MEKLRAAMCNFENQLKPLEGKLAKIEPIRAGHKGKWVSKNLGSKLHGTYLLG